METIQKEGKKTRKDEIKKEKKKREIEESEKGRENKLRRKKGRRWKISKNTHVLEEMQFSYSVNKKTKKQTKQ